MSNPTELDDGLTDEERAALSDDGDIVNADPGTGEADEQDTERAAEAAATAAEPDGDAGAAADATDPAAAADEEPAPEAKQQPAPILVAPPPEDAAAKLTEIGEKKDALLDQFDNGDITAKEYQKQLDSLAKEERAIERAQDRAELAASMEQQRLQNDWISTCNAFVDSNPIYKDNPRLYKALDAEVRELASKPESANWSGQKFLDEAHKNLAQAFNLPASKTPTPKTPHTPRKDLPPNLAKVPAANLEDTSGGRFAVLDRMASTDPLGYEEALARMPAAERDAYLAS